MTTLLTACLFFEILVHVLQKHARKLCSATFYFMTHVINKAAHEHCVGRVGLMRREEVGKKDNTFWPREWPFIKSIKCTEHLFATNSYLRKS